MPGDTTALIIYACLLLPGFVFAIARAPHRPATTRSNFRETVAAAFVSLICLTVTVAAAVAGSFLFGHGDIVQRALRNPQDEYLVDPVRTIAIGLALLAIASLLGLLAGSALGHKLVRIVRRRSGPETGGSSWHQAFTQHKNMQIRLGLTLTDGAWLEGTLFTFDSAGTDTPDRALLLSGQVRFRPPGAESIDDLDPNIGLVVVADRHIRIMTVTYVEPRSVEDQKPITRERTLKRRNRRTTRLS